MNAGESRRTAVIVLNWNRPDLTLACLDSLLPVLQGLEVTLIVCDNASEDDSLAQIRTWGRHYFSAQVAPERAGFLLLRTPRNLGFAGGNNVAIHWALRLGFDFVWLLNNDTRVFPDTLERLLEAATLQPRVGCFGATLLEGDDPAIVQCAGGCRFNPLLTTYHQLYQGRAYDQVLELPVPQLDYVAGASMFLRSRALRQAGLLNESYFLYFEELDLAHRLRRQGYDLAWCPAARVVHEGSASIPATEYSHYHENLSTLKYLWQHHRGLFPLAAAIRGLGKCIYLPLTGRSRLLPSLLRAYRDFRPCGYRAVDHPAELVWSGLECLP